jgi:redox-sensitive bicupin YhaK (pirin superfamily)
MIELVIEQRRRDLGGIEVGRVLPWAKRRMVGPFVFFDHMGPIDLPANLPRSVDVRPHPHIGLSTVTYLFEGELMHRDSVGSEQAVRPGAVNWMTAGRGISHSERFERARREGDHMHGIQAWVALPEALEETAPSFVHYPAEALPVFEEPGLRGRLIAGEAFGLRAGVQTHSPMFYLHLELETGARLDVPPQYSERAAYVATGAIEVAARASRRAACSSSKGGGQPCSRPRARPPSCCSAANHSVRASSSGTSCPPRRSASSRRKPTGARAG